MNEKKSVFYFSYAIVFVVLLAIIGISFSYAYIQVTATDNFGNTYNVSSSAECLDMNYLESNLISLSNQYPLQDVQGSKLTPVTITIKNNCNNSVQYSLFFTSLYMNPSSGYIEDSKVKIQSDGNVAMGIKMVNTLNIVSSSSNTYKQINANLASRNNVKDYIPRTSYYLSSNTTPNILAANATHTINVRLWIDYYEGGSSSNASNNNSTQGKDYAGAFTLVSPGIG